MYEARQNKEKVSRVISSSERKIVQRQPPKSMSNRRQKSPSLSKIYTMALANIGKMDLFKSWCQANGVTREKIINAVKDNAKILALINQDSNELSEPTLEVQAVDAEKPVVIEHMPSPDIPDEKPDLPEELANAYSFCIERVTKIWNSCHSQPDEGILFSNIFPLVAFVSDKHIIGHRNADTSGHSTLISQEFADADMKVFNDFLSKKNIRESDGIVFTQYQDCLSVIINGHQYGCKHKKTDWVSDTFYPVNIAAPVQTEL